MFRNLININNKFNLINTTVIRTQLLPILFNNNKINKCHILFPKTVKCLSTSSTAPHPDATEPTSIDSSESSTIIENENTMDKEKILKVLQLELSVMKQEGKKVPDPEWMKDSHWEHLLTLQTRSARRRYYSYLFSLQMIKQNILVKKNLKREENAQKMLDLRQENERNDHIIYGLSHTTFFLRIYESTMNLWHNNKLTRAMQFNQPLILDCSYDEFMNNREAVNAAKQLMLCFAENRNHDQPFDLHFCNVNLQSTTMKYLIKHIPTILEKSFPLHIHEKNYLDIFPKEKLVYLTPHCRNDLYEYNHDDIYIVGAMVDKTNNQPLSLAKAKRYQLRMARLPLDRYLQWGSGSGKSLTLNQMNSILLDIKCTNNWNEALKHVPRRKLINNYSENSVSKYRLQIFPQQHHQQRHHSEHEENLQSRGKNHFRKNNNDDDADEAVNQNQQKQNPFSINTAPRKTNVTVGGRVNVSQKPRKFNVQQIFDDEDDNNWNKFKK